MSAPEARSGIVPSDVTVIVRSAGERTRDKCYEIVCEQVPRGNVVPISERPFTRALRMSFEIGIEQKRPWTLCIDADVLLRRSGVELLLHAAQTTGDDVFQIQGEVLDKLFGGPRLAGNRLFRTSLLVKALNFVPAHNVSLRPETFVVEKMASEGHPYLKHSVVVGIHDFEQYYRDIYRKAFVHAHKHAVEVRRYAEPMWKRLAKQDSDYQVALWGLRAGRIFDGPVQLDVCRSPQDINALLLMQGWREKGNYTNADHADWDVDQFINTFTSAPEYRSWRKIFEANTYATSTSVRASRFRQVMTKTGWVRVAPRYAVRGLQLIGGRLQTWAEK